MYNLLYILKNLYKTKTYSTDMDICIKNVDREEWLNFKSESAKHGMKAGEFFAKIIKEHKKQTAKIIGKKYFLEISH